jgi:cysteine-rich repeat protein
VCGNGTLESGEECDDGNHQDGDGCESDCTYTCEENADCRDESMCNGEEICDTAGHTCEPGEALENGFVCAAEPRSICLDGACEVSTCGDGFVDLGGGEFCEPPGEDDCSAECHLLCDDNEDCPDDGEICNGVEECLLETGECTHVYGLDDGAECGEDPRRICIALTCQDSLCGDGYTDVLLDPAEECDDMNTTAGDGCENDCTFTCRINADCDDGRVCTDDRCDIISHTCAAFIADPGEVCRPAAEGAPCDVAETCDGENADCPADGFLGSSVVCRGSAGICDVEESCDGTGPQCPVDAFQPDTFMCRAATRTCDPAENCTGDGPTCPDDEYNCACSSDADCPDDGNPCNGIESCNISSGECVRSSPPGDGTMCQSSPRKICLDGLCVFSMCGDGFLDPGNSEECDDGNGIPYDGCEDDCTYSCHSHAECNDFKICTTDTCNPSSHMCEYAMAPHSTMCRASAGDCDVVEYCTGTTAVCPVDSYLPAGEACGPAGTICQGQAFCTGLSPDCPPPLLLCWDSVDGGDSHTCGIKQDQNLFCWGSNGSGQLGNGSSASSYFPVKVSLDSTFEVVSAGGNHSCAVAIDTKLYCWGANGSGQLGDGTNVLKRVPTLVSNITEGWSDVCTGYTFSCGIAEGLPYCWGSNSSGQLGIGSSGGSFNTPHPVDITSIEVDFVQISCGGQHTCAFTSDGVAYCWGLNSSGQLGDGTTMNRNRPTLVHRGGDTEPWTYVACGDSHTCGLSGGDVLCWGENGSYQIGDGTTVDRTMPVMPVFSGTTTPGTISSAAAGGSHSCVTDDNRIGFCWGNNAYGQLGIGSTDPRYTPARINYSDWKTIEAGKDHTCALKAGNPTLWCWGRNSQGQVGDGTNAQKNNPVQVR